MTPAEKGERYARLFRKAGAHLGRGNIALALKALKEGETLASGLGDEQMARRFAEEATRISESKPPEDAPAKDAPGPPRKRP